ncbi:HNH endonuclease [Fimbriimonas ginsengisoli]|uniref:HNH endonuclease n=1 Tax=Fimbriimonas ginsengisoli TaxID=1005039 RepID=UPI001D0E221F|nr:HNH endonuclease [Fimbriimonas ginsengisoli]
MVSSEELMIVAGIIDYQRRIRELRCEAGWKILSGKTAKLLVNREDSEAEEIEPDTAVFFAAMKPDDYYLVDTEADTDAARRWHVANRIRNLDVGVRERVLAYLRENVGRPVFGEELAYVADDAGDWPRRTRELRTEYGWPVATKTSGRPDLPIGVYVLEEDRQAPEHDRHIPDSVRGQVLQRDNFACCNCGWSHAIWNPSDPRHLELHHLHEHVRGGQNTAENLLTLCTVCHDGVHAGRIALGFG